MGSTMKFDDYRSPRMQHGTLVYPDEIFGRCSVSVLRVLDVALLGLGVDQSITWIDTADLQQRITMLEIASRANQAGSITERAGFFCYAQTMTIGISGPVHREPWRGVVVALFGGAITLVIGLVLLALASGFSG